MGRPSKRMEIVQAAARLIAERGLDAVSMSDVAKAAGVRTASVYRLFSDKTVLFEDVLHFILDEADILRHRYLTSRATPEEKVKATVYYSIYDSGALFLHRQILQRALVNNDVETLEIIRKFQSPQTEMVIESIRKIKSQRDPFFILCMVISIPFGYVDFKPLLSMIHTPIKKDFDIKYLTDQFLQMIIPEVDWKKVKLLPSTVTKPASKRPESISRERKNLAKV